MLLSSLDTMQTHAAVPILHTVLYATRLYIQHGSTCAITLSSEYAFDDVDKIFIGFGVGEVIYDLFPRFLRVLIG